MASLLAAVKFAISKIPLVLKTVLFHTFSLSPTSHKWDLRSELVITMIRDFLNNSPPSTISEQQAMFLKDPGVQGKMWVSKATLPAPPEDALRDRLFEVIASLGNGGEQYSKPNLQPVEAEWVGYRALASDKTPEPSIPEQEKYENLIKEVESHVTILYFHGGSNYLMDPVSTRPVSAKYATLTRGRVFSVRYRLAPQDPFPAALLDALVSYLSLLYPPPGAWHEPIPASSIVVCGDSAGGNIASSLLQTLLQIHRDATVGGLSAVLFHGKVVSVPLPAGVTLNSPSLDLTRCMQWSEANSKYDYLPPPSFSAAQSPRCEVWPTVPPRVDLFCEGSALSHPLVSPLAAASWANSPPIFLVCGEELLTDECKTLAQKAAKQGVRVVWEQYEAMPHCFALLLSWNAAAATSFDGWTKFVKRAVERPDEVETSAEWIAAKSLDRRPVDIYTLINVSDQDVITLMESARAGIESRFSYLCK